MAAFDTDLMIQKNLADFCQVREKVINLLAQAEKLIDMADEEMEAVVRYGLPYDAKMRESLTRVTKEIDQRLWHSAFDLTGFGQLMDHKARAEFNRDLEQNPPVFSVENVRSIFLSAAQTKDEMFARGLVNVFRRLSDDHKTNTQNTFKVNRKAVLTFICEPWFGELKIRYGRGADELNDLDRVFKTLDGKKHHPRELETAINGAFKAGGNLYEDEYYKIRGFKNGNMHIVFKRDDLLDKANRIIHDYYHGQALAKGKVK